MNQTIDDRAVYLGVKGTLVKIDPNTGDELWRRHLKSSGMVNVVVTAERLLAHAGGHLFAVDRETGDVLWENSMSGLGYGFCCIATANGDGNSTAMQAHQVAQQQAAANAAAAVAAPSAATAS